MVDMESEEHRRRIISVSAFYHTNMVAMRISVMKNTVSSCNIGLLNALNKLCVWIKYSGFEVFIAVKFKARSSGL
jgi:hypothetical protein